MKYELTKESAFMVDNTDILSKYRCSSTLYVFKVFLLK